MKGCVLVSALRPGLLFAFPFCLSLFPIRLVARAAAASDSQGGVPRREGSKPDASLHDMRAEGADGSASVAATRSLRTWPCSAPYAAWRAPKLWSVAAHPAADESRLDRQRSPQFPVVFPAVCSTRPLEQKHSVHRSLSMRSRQRVFRTAAVIQCLRMRCAMGWEAAWLQQPLGATHTGVQQDGIIRRAQITLHDSSAFPRGNPPN